MVSQLARGPPRVNWKSPLHSERTRGAMPRRAHTLRRCCGIGVGARVPCLASSSPPSLRGMTSSRRHRTVQAVFLLPSQPLHSPSPRPVPWFSSRHLADSRSFSRAQHLAAGTPPSPRPWFWSVFTTALRDSPSVCAAPLGSTAIVHRAHSQWRPSVLCCRRWLWRRLS